MQHRVTQQARIEYVICRMQHSHLDRLCAMQCYAMHGSPPSAKHTASFFTSCNNAEHGRPRSLQAAAVHLQPTPHSCTLTLQVVLDPADWLVLPKDLLSGSKCPVTPVNRRAFTLVMQIAEDTRSAHVMLPQQQPTATRSDVHCNYLTTEQEPLQKHFQHSTQMSLKYCNSNKSTYLPLGSSTGKTRSCTSGTRSATCSTKAASSSG